MDTNGNGNGSVGNGNGNAIANVYYVVATKDAVLPTDGSSVAYAVSRNDGKKGKSGIVCVAPVITGNMVSLFLHDPIGQAYFTDCMAGLRSKIISALHSKGKIITGMSIDLAAMLVMARTETESQRMTKEAIGQWFDMDLADRVMVAIRAKMTGIADDKLVKLAEGYKVKFMTLASREVNMPLQVKAQLVKAMELLPEDYESVIGEKVAAALAEAEEAMETLAAL